MKLKQLSKFLFAILLVFTLASCNSDNDTEYTYDLSADAQIYDFKLSMNKATDSANHQALANTRFAIDQISRFIYNPDSLPYGTKRAKYYASLRLTGNSTPEQLKTQLVYLDSKSQDSIVDWNGKDSVDFSIPKYPKFLVTPPNGGSPREYIVDVRIHQVDPDTINWKRIPSFHNSYITGNQKTILIENTFYTFSQEFNKLYLLTAPKAEEKYTSKKEITSLSAVKLESITYFNGKIYALNNANQAYASTDGLNWSYVASNIESILGILPNLDKTKNTLLVVTKSAGTKTFATTTDMSNITDTDVDVPSNFPIYGFSSVTNYDSGSASRNILTVTGGYTGESYSNLTHYFTVNSGGELQYIVNQSNTTFEAKEGIVCFMYDNYMYALTGNQFYKSSSWGSKWVKASSKEMLDPDMPKAYGQSVIVDDDNFIWIFGGITDSGNIAVQQVWKGRINKLNPKK